MHYFFCLIAIIGLFQFDLKAQPKDFEFESTAEYLHSNHSNDFLSKNFSNNWCGFVAKPQENLKALSKVKKVFGKWIIPKLHASSESAKVCIWVGIDGCENETVEQIGTMHEYVDGFQNDYAWFEMFPLPLYKIINYPVEPGDMFEASVEYLGDSVFELYIHNLTKNKKVTIPHSYTIQPNSQRASAEWIVEAPTHSGVILPLANFETVFFDDCSYELTKIPGAEKPSQKWQWYPFIILSDNKELALPLRLNDQSFYVERCINQ